MGNRLKIVLDGVSYEVERQGDLLLVNGREFPYEVDGASVNVGGNPHTVEVQGDTVVVDGIAYPIEVIGLEEPQPRSHKAKSTAAGDESGALTAIMPGLITKILKQAGEQVAAGEVILILEAMKMQNELCAPRAGVVKQITANEGETVAMRQVLVVIE